MDIIKLVIELIRKKGLNSILFDNRKSSLLMKYITTPNSRLTAMSTFVQDVDIDASEIELTIAQPEFGVANVIAEEGTTAIVGKLEQKTQKSEGFYTAESIIFKKHELSQLLSAAKNPNASNAELQLVATSIIRNKGNLNGRLLRLLEKHVWEGIFKGVMTIAVKDSAAPLEIVTGTTVLADLTGTDKWDDIANSNPYEDIQNLDKEFEDTGMEADVIFARKETIRNLVKTQAFANKASELELSEAAKEGFIRTWGSRRIIFVDGSYQENKGYNETRTKFLPEGYIVLAAMGGLTEAPVKKYNFRNLDPVDEKSTQQDYVLGEYSTIFYKSVRDGKPPQANLHHSWAGVPIFDNPAVFASQKVY